MARVSRNPKKVAALAHAEKINHSYKTAVYARLSVEDNGIDSDSLESQIELLENFVKQQAKLSHFKTYYDNGATGTNFDRAGFNEMMADIKCGYVNCVVVKDLSRFGRNYIETGEYLDNIFPYLDVRFISVNDHYDSNDVSSNEALMVALKSVLHDIYSKDISRKICTVFDVKKQSGEYLGRYAPYGYRKSEAEKNKLLVNEETAPVVRDIFNWRIGGLGVTAIARKLNDLDVPSQFRYLYDKGIAKRTTVKESSLWRGSSVKELLENPNYIGCIVERKSENAHYKGGKEQLIPKSEWRIIRNTHESIIDEETFEAVQNLMEESRNIRKGYSKQSNRPGCLVEQQKCSSFATRPENILRGLIVCGCCGSKMERDGGYYSSKKNKMFFRFSCPRKYIKNGICTSNGAKEDVLLEVISQALKMQIKAFHDAKLLIDSFIKSDDCESIRKQILNHIVSCENKIVNINRLKKTLYEDFRGELLTQREYLYAKETYQKNADMLAVKITELSKRLLSLNEPLQGTGKATDVLSFVSEQELTAKMCKTLIEKIEVDGDKIKIFYSFTDELEKLREYHGKLNDGGYNL